MKILIAEDEALIALSLRAGLLKAGHEVCQVVATGEAAIASAMRELPDLLVMDIGLAGKLDGIEATWQIRQEHPAPVIFLTGYPDETIRQRAYSLQPAACLMKPIGIFELIEVVNRIQQQIATRSGGILQ